jgi:hypothetical protein
MVSGKNLLWGLAACLFVWRLVHVGMLAFSQPWTGTGAQWEFALFAFCAVAIVATLAIVGQRHGFAELRRRLRASPEFYRAYGDRSGARKNRVGNFLIWIIVALVLVVVFQFQQHR